jgi:hypothetical protein
MINWIHDFSQQQQQAKKTSHHDKSKKKSENGEIDDQDESDEESKGQFNSKEQEAYADRIIKVHKASNPGTLVNEPSFAPLPEPELIPKLIPLGRKVENAISKEDSFRSEFDCKNLSFSVGLIGHSNCVCLPHKARIIGGDRLYVHVSIAETLKVWGNSGEFCELDKVYRKALPKCLESTSAIVIEYKGNVVVRLMDTEEPENLREIRFNVNNVVGHTGDPTQFYIGFDVIPKELVEASTTFKNMFHLRIPMITYQKNPNEKFIKINPEEAKKLGTEIETKLMDQVFKQ